MPFWRRKKFLVPAAVVSLVAVLAGGYLLTKDKENSNNQDNPPHTVKEEKTEAVNDEGDLSYLLNRTYSNKKKVTMPVTLSGNQVLRIEDTHYILANDITLRDKAKLIIKGSLFEHKKDHSFQYGMTVHDNAQVILENTVIGNNCTGSLNWGFFDNSSMKSENVEQEDCNIWHLFTDNSTATIKNHRFNGTFCGNSDGDIDGGIEMEVELCWDNDAVVDTSLPQKVKSLSFPRKGDKNLNFKLKITDSTVDGWGIGLPPNSDITLRDSARVTISIIVGTPIQNQTVVLDGLKKKLYKDKTWNVAGAKLHLINTGIYGWEPNVFCCNNKLIIRNSDYTGNTNNSSNGEYLIENSKVDDLQTQEQVTMTVKNSKVTNDVIATGDSVITLINTKVGGKIVEEDNGQVIVK